MSPTSTAPASQQPDPPKDPPATTLPENIDALLRVGRYLLGYGRHLLDTIRQRATAPNFAAIAANFGTASLPAITARLNRGILRCIALERVLLARAAAGRDIAFTPRDTWQTLQPGPDPADAPAPARPAPAAPLQATDPLPQRPRAARACRPAFRDDPALYMPTVEELERQIRRLPIGRVFLAIALDLAVVPAFCHPELWNALFDIMNWFGGGQAVSQLMREKSRRRAAFEKEQDRNPKATWDWLNLSRDAPRQILGFFIGEPPVNPLDPAAAIATGPP